MQFYNFMKRTKQVLLLGILLFISGINFGQTLSPYSKISIITCAPGNELYSTFGHSAIRIKDPVFRIDKVYNYGTFNFETPGFYMKFVRGKLDYMLSVSPYHYFVMSYKQEKRAIYEQVLNLSNSQKDSIYKALEINSLPENMYYRYDFLKDNCSTRVLKIINSTLKNNLILPEKLSGEPQSYREMLMPYLKGKEWERFGINLALGRPTDKIVNVENASFLPDYLKNILDISKIKTKTGTKPFVIQENTLYAPSQKNIRKSLSFVPERIFWILLIIILSITIVETRKNRNFLILDKTLFFIVGFVGLNILFLWFATDHSSVVNNKNIIWASPLFFIAAFLLHRNNKKFLRIFFLLSSLLITIFFVADLFYISLFDIASIPIELILIVRSAMIYLRK